MIRVLVVDDNTTVRRVMVGAIRKMEGFECLAEAEDGLQALEMIRSLKPDLVLMDLYMPNLDGFGVLEKYKGSSVAFVVLTGSIHSDDADRAKLLGAKGFLIKEEVAGAQGIVQKLKEAFSQALYGNENRSVREKKETCISSDLPEEPVKKQTLVSSRTIVSKGSRGFALPCGFRPGRFKAVVIGSSTGGPEALHRFFSTLPPDFSLPIFIVQHIRPEFASRLCQRLQENFLQQIVMVEQAMEVKLATIYMAPGSMHIALRASSQKVFVELEDSPPQHFCKPSANVLFESASRVYKKNLLALIFTGMGQDGLEGACEIVNNGGDVIVQDEKTSIVWGMPGAIAAKGIASGIYPLDEMMPAMLKTCQG